MKRLILMRHAKSSWKNLELADHERPLNERGLSSAKNLGLWLNERGYLPNQVICSTAVRCMETLGGLNLKIEASYEAKLYHAHVGYMLDLLQSAQQQTVLLIGHNPGISAFAEGLLNARPHLQDFYRYPTGATTVIDFVLSDWDKLELRSGTLVDFVIPRDLT